MSHQWLTAPGEHTSYEGAISRSGITEHTHRREDLVLHRGVLAEIVAITGTMIAQPRMRLRVLTPIETRCRGLHRP